MTHQLLMRISMSFCCKCYCWSTNSIWKWWSK